MKLHLGCGTKHLDGFINVDSRYIPEVDVADDIRTLTKFQNDSAELIYACHVLEHVGRREYMAVLKRWHEILKSDGILRLAVPDFESVVNHYVKNHNIEAVRGLLWGGQDYPTNYHYIGWDFDRLKKDLEEIGFKNVQRYDRDKTEHSHVDDYSASFLPKMDRGGMLMSLNVTCIK
jgi:predicted SAM-dependent methyltransferase